MLVFPDKRAIGLDMNLPKLLRKDKQPIDDDRSTAKRRVVLEMSQPETIEQPQIRADEQGGVEPGRRDEPAVEFLQPRAAERPAHSPCAECLDDRLEFPSSCG